MNNCGVRRTSMSWPPGGNHVNFTRYYYPNLKQALFPNSPCHIFIWNQRTKHTPNLWICCWLLCLGSIPLQLLSLTIPSKFSIIAGYKCWT